MVSSHLVGLQDPSLFIEEAHVNGAWLAARSGKTFDIQDPATTEVIGTCPEFSTEDTKLAIAAASKALSSFRRTTARERSRLLRKWYDLILEHQEDLSFLITLENGKSRADSRGETAYAASFLEWFSEEAPRAYGDLIPSTNRGNQIVTVKEPVGVCGLITPWNFPAAMITRKVGAALAAGCTVVIKSPAETPFTINALIELARRAGIPKGVINVVTAMENTIEVVHALTSSPSVHKISFTGSTNVGKILLRQCAESTLKKVSLELGGNAPFIVFNDADVDAAVNGAIASKFRCSGQTCVSANRIYVQEAVHDEFARKLAKRIKDEFTVGNSLTSSKVTHGPLIHSRAVAKTHEHVRDALSKGAKLLVGGHKMPELGPNFFQPTLLTGMTSDMKLAQEETFGPVAGIFSFNTEREVVSLANDTEMGLAAYLFSRELNQVWRVARALDVGMVGVNTGVISDPASPFGGAKSSGFGREGSKYGIEEYMHIKTLTLGGVDMTPQSHL